MPSQLVEFSLVGRRGQLVTSSPKRGPQIQAEKRGDRVCNSFGEISAQEMFAPLNDPKFLHSVQKINLATKSFTLSAAELLAEKIKQMKNLEIADISDCIAGIPGDEATPVLCTLGAALAGLPKLREFQCNDNALGPRLHAFAGLLTGQLETLSLCVTGMSSLACQQCVQHLLDNGPLPLRLKKLHFAESTSNADGVIAIATLFKHTPDLEDFRCAGVRCEPRGMENLCQALVTDKPPLRSVDISDNGFVNKSHDATIPLGRALETSLGRTIERLDLSYTNIKRQGFLNISKGLRQCHGLVALSLNDIDVGIADEDMSSFFDLLSSGLPALRELSIAEFYLDGSLEECVTALRERSKKGWAGLQLLDVSGNGIPDSEAKKLIDFVKESFDENASYGFDPQGLRLDKNELSREFVDCLVESFAKAGRADELGSLNENMMDDVGVTYNIVDFVPRERSVDVEAASTAEAKTPEVQSSSPVVVPGAINTPHSSHGQKPTSHASPFIASSVGTGIVPRVATPKASSTSKVHAAATAFIQDCEAVRNRSWPAAMAGRSITVTHKVDVGGGQTVEYTASIPI